MRVIWGMGCDNAVLKPIPDPTSLSSIDRILNAILKSGVDYDV